MVKLLTQVMTCAMVAVMSQVTTSVHPLQTWREEHDFTIREIAELSGASPAMLVRIITGERSPSPAMKVKIARRLGATVGELFPVEPLTDEDEGEFITDRDDAPPAATPGASSPRAAA